ncbi:MAG: hypothetical protein ACREFJ_01195 [Acetobacteraceae bacterium]
MVTAEHQAEALLTPCKKLGLSADLACNQNQQFFVQQYVRALSGSWDDAFAEAGDYSLVDRASCAAKPKCKEVNASGWIGIPADQVSACTWSALAVALKKPSPYALDYRKAFGTWPPDPMRESVHHQCDPLSMIEKGRAFDRTMAFAHRIADDPVALPSPGWWLPWPTIEPFEGHP